MAGKGKKRSKCSKGGSPAPKKISPLQKTLAVTKSHIDPNQYRIIVLQNGLTVTLISRPNPTRPGPFSDSDSNSADYKTPYSLSNTATGKTYKMLNPLFMHDPDPYRNKSEQLGKPLPTTSVAISMNVGALNDPRRCQGLAHFMEHMVHFGSRKFPEPDEIIFNFGYHNAMTSPDWTVYFSEMPDLVLDQYFERITSMLTEPKLEKKTMDLEIRSVDDEFYLHLPDMRRYMLFDHVSVEGPHPLTNMLCGSLETLGNNDMTDPKATDEVHKEMCSSHRKHYVASAMTATIHSTKSLDDLEKLATKYLSGFLTGPHKTIKASQPPKNPPKFRSRRHVYLKGLGSQPALFLQWHIPPSKLGDPKNRVIPYIVRQLQDTSPGTLLHTLWSKGWIFAAEIGITFNNHYTCVLEVALLLSPDGEGNAEEITEMVFKYLNFLEGVKPEEMNRLFEEMRLLHLYMFHFANNSKSAIMSTLELTLWSQIFGADSDLLFTEAWKNAEFNYTGVRGILKYLQEEEYFTVIQIVHKQSDLGKFGRVQKAPYSGASFVEVPRGNKPPVSRKGPSLNGSGDTSTGNCMPFAFPLANKYLELDLKLFFELTRDNKVPCDNLGVIIKPDDVGPIDPVRFAINGFTGEHLGHFSQPGSAAHLTAGITVLLTSPLSRKAIYHKYSLLWTSCIKQMLMPLQSQINGAGYYCSVEKSGNWIKIQVHGKSRDITDVLESVIDVTLNNQVTNVVLSLGKRECRKSFHRMFKDPKSFSSSGFQKFVKGFMQPLCAVTENKQEDISEDSLNQFITQFKHTTSCHISLNGNVPVQAFYDVSAYLARLIRPPGSEKCIRMLMEESEDYTTVVVNEYILPFTGKEKDAHYFEMAMGFISGAAFSELRSKQQLGYGVYAGGGLSSGDMEPRQEMMFVVAIMATKCKFTVCELDQKIDQFCADFGSAIARTKDNVYNGMLDVKGIPASVTKTAVADWFKELFPEDFGIRDIKNKCKNAGIRKMSYQMLSGNEDMKIKECEECEICSDLRWTEISPLIGIKFAQGKDYAKDYFVSII